MGSDNLFWKKKRNTLRREVGRKGKEKETFLIVCEGECTEPNYFKSFRLTSALIKGTGYNTLSLVEKTIEIRDQEIDKGKQFDQVWSVFDRDDHSTHNFNEAFNLAKRNNIKIAYSNEAFELWYLLHFNLLCTGISRKSYIIKLHKLLGHKYCKNSETIYDEIIDKQSDAIKNAKTLNKQYNPKLNPEKAKPSTNVYKLVEQLNRNL